MEVLPPIDTIDPDHIATLEYQTLAADPPLPLPTFSWQESTNNPSTCLVLRR